MKKASDALVQPTAVDEVTSRCNEKHHEDS
ncbi:hypothetical protein Pla52n_34400 [Stieleria varia]|uniref:Uncharacterized protein n=1 Tax=Stieleria varia TaxID=2528005 RepID=A0A5C6ARR3_9BACT|nr:hypothetical protein Pla52n_34400 [Stieleria varia]